MKAISELVMFVVGPIVVSLLFIAALLLSSGCMKFSTTMNINLQGNVRENLAVDLVRSSYAAYNGLKDCKYFAARYPTQHMQLDALAHSLTIKTMSPEHLDIVEGHYGMPVCGAAEMNSNTIFINPFAGCDWDRTIAHEMLHALGLDHPDRYCGGSMFHKVLEECGFI